MRKEAENIKDWENVVSRRLSPLFVPPRIRRTICCRLMIIFCMSMIALILPTNLLPDKFRGENIIGKNNGSSSSSKSSTTGLRHFDAIGTVVSNDSYVDPDTETTHSNNLTDDNPVSPILQIANNVINTKTELKASDAILSNNSNVHQNKKKLALR